MRILLYIFLLVNLAALAGNEPELPDESVEICPSVMQSTTLTSLSLTIIATEMVFNFYFLSDYTNGLGANHDHYFS
ncbi:MAG: hypothetical protein U9R19_16075, partial [Bacteroidota bacterium]|nr:hypothetical protein [Bacteroidota bacterium]